MRWVGKTRTVRIATKGGDQVYHSIEDVPAELRKIVTETLEGPNSETVLIANQEAYERLSRQIRDLPAGFEQLVETETPPPETEAPPQFWKWGAATILAAVLILWVLWIWVIRGGVW